MKKSAILDEIDGDQYGVVMHSAWAEYSVHVREGWPLQPQRFHLFRVELV